MVQSSNFNPPQINIRPIFQQQTRMNTRYECESLKRKERNEVTRFFQNRFFSPLQIPRIHDFDRDPTSERSYLRFSSGKPIKDRKLVRFWHSQLNTGFFNFKYFLPVLYILCGNITNERNWCSGIIVPSHGTDRGSIPRLRMLFIICSVFIFNSSLLFFYRCRLT